MYKVIGADGKEYGPITADVLKQWIADNRANAQTKVLPEGATEWQTVADIPELAGALPAVPALMVPAIQPSGRSAAALVKGPAIALIVTSSLGILYYLVSGVVTLAGGALFQRDLPANIPSELRSILEGMHGPLASLINFAVVALNGFVLFGAIKLLRLQSYGIALAACIVAMLPCQCCCVLGLPFGVWALVVMSKPEVKAQFG